ncbi:nitroreductase family protein [Amaricoccus solimangrovi]|uniref:Nitroreductase family protein n=1 Tax=Amaricoccus solimangrovi TaxID=2589815 RepID=A0A501X0Z6_9RHOB|nr:nitroreductase family protein [Amaricoccus solimangrovi]TPE53851.1 nitroreductase family protein [Amaricoccus solimangrovi]
MNQITPITRTSEHDVDPLFLDRWSPRAYDGQPLTEAELLRILEAAHWAPSAYNFQPWRFVYALKGTPEFDKLLGLLVEFNQSWAKDAGALVFIVSKTHSLAPGAEKETELYSHSFDAGAAWGLLSLQARLSGFYAHGMTGLKFDALNEGLGVPEGYRVEAATAIGRIADPSVLPEGLRGGEVPSKRKPLAEVVFKGELTA